MADDKFGFGKMIKRLHEAKSTLPNALAHAGQLFFQQNFDKAKWDGVPWKPRVSETRKSKGKHLLVRTGNLRQSLQNSIRSVSWEKIVWGTDVPYAKYLNFGTDKMVAREFMGENKELKEKLLSKIKFAFDKIMLNK